MNKGLKIALNVVIFLVIAGFGFFMIRSMSSDQRTPRLGEGQEISTFVSPYRLVNYSRFHSDILNFDIYNGEAFVVVEGGIIRTIIDSMGGMIIVEDDFAGHDIRDIFAVNNRTIYLLYPNRIGMYRLGREVEKIGGWESHNPNSDYRAFAITENYIFVTDVGERQVVQYRKDGSVVRFFRSPDRFILPDPEAFDIIAINDTIFVTNSGRHRIESYTLNGKFITYFGTPGAQAGGFAGCCNPIFIAATPGGNILTSEKGRPRISSFGRDGSFRMVLFDSQALGGGTHARRIRVCEENNVFIANRNTISVYTFDSTRVERTCSRACAGCTRACRK
ncbi:MAG: hypothetical protein FWD02_00250 [Bacteroidales bacterium]|nr:hypothetical protein [Bacteroidales bacterium]